ARFYQGKLSGDRQPPRRDWGIYQVASSRRGLCPTARSRIRRRLPSGRSGVLSILAPNGESASSTAAASAAAGGSAPLSPTPLTPSGLSELGVTRCAIRIVGTSLAVGNAYSSNDWVRGWPNSS